MKGCDKMELITVKSMELRVMSNKTKIILVSIVGVVVVFGIGALAGNLMHGSNTGAKATTSVSSKSSTKSSSSSKDKYVEGKDYTIEYYEASGTSKSLINKVINERTDFGPSEKDMNNVISKEVYYTSSDNDYEFVLTKDNGKHEYYHYDFDSDELHSGTKSGSSVQFNEAIHNGDTKLVYRFINKKIAE